MTPTERTSEPSADELYRLALDLALGAADLVRRSAAEPDGARGGSRVVEVKSTPTDLVTSTDRAAERWLVDQIGRHRPGDAVLGEEGGDHDPDGADARVRWILDPIDGTVNFVLGLPQYAVSVAAELDGVVVAGAVANPATGEVFHALRGGGARLGHTDSLPAQPGRMLTGPRDVPLARAVIASGFGYDAALRARQAAVVAALLPRIGDLRRLGAAALDLCFVAAGRLDGYFEAGLNPWDHAAGALIAQEAGCIVSGLRGRAASGQLVVAAGAVLAADLAAILTELGADQVL